MLRKPKSINKTARLIREFISNVPHGAMMIPTAKVEKQKCGQEDGKRRAPDSSRPFRSRSSTSIRSVGLGRNSPHKINRQSKMTEMQEAVCHEGGRVELRSAPIPKAGADELVLKVRAVGVNPKDYKTELAPYLPINQGNDVAGLVTEVGSAVTGFKVRPFRGPLCI